MRLIDADDIIVKLEAKRNNWDNKNAMHRAMRGAYVDSILIVRDAPTVEAEPVNSWISVKDKMPEYNCVYIVCRTVGEHQICFAAHWDGSKWISVVNNKQLDYITHWQPLPKPTKEVQE